MQVKCHLLDILPLRLWEICKYHTSHCICLVLISCIKTWYKKKHFRTFVRCFSSCSRFLTSDLRFSFLFDSALCTFASAFCCSLSSISSFFSIPPASYGAHHEQMKALFSNNSTIKYNRHHHHQIFLYWNKIPLCCKCRWIYKSNAMQYELNNILID